MIIIVCRWITIKDFIIPATVDILHAPTGDADIVQIALANVVNVQCIFVSSVLEKQRKRLKDGLV